MKKKNKTTEFSRWIFAVAAVVAAVVWRDVAASRFEATAYKAHGVHGLGSAAAPQSLGASDVTSQPLVQQSSLVYQGSFRLPAVGTSDAQGFAYGGAALAYNAARGGNGSLFLVGFDPSQLVGEVSVPALKTGAVSGLSTATLLQSLTDITEGKLPLINPGDPNAKKIGGLLPYQGNLYATAFAYYDGNGTQKLSHFKQTGLTITTPGDVIGPLATDAIKTGYVSGYMGVVPSAWQAALGGPAFTGNCCLSIIGRTSYGPAVSTFNPLDVGVTSPIPTHELLYYPGANPGNSSVDMLAPCDATGIYFNCASEVKGIVMPEGTRSVLFFGRHGLGTFCYGEGTTNQALNRQPTPDGTIYCYDPESSDKGAHAYPYSYYVWAYDANDLAAVKAGSKVAWTVKPYAVWALSLPYTARSTGISGATYDPATGRIFLTQDFGDGNLPLVHVMTVGGAVAPSNTVNTLSINGGAAFTNSLAVTLTISAPSAVQMEISNDSGFAGASYGPYASQQNWTLSAAHVVYARFKDGSGVVSASVQATIGLDTTPPTGSVTVTGSTLILNATDTGGSGLTGMAVSSSPTFAGAAFQAFAPTLAWTLPGAVYVKFQDGAGNVSAIVTQNGPPGPVAPFGEVDTPVQSATGVVGSVSMTGWALDDIGVASVRIYRNCLAFDAPAVCSGVLGNNVVYLGDATFVSGARPDIEAAFPTVPQSARGGWGYLLMTNLLPNVPSQLGYGGQGSLTLYAFAADGDTPPNMTLLGRTQTDHTPTAITMANNSIAKPFGAIDTPGQGATVSGSLANFGWALTPDSDQVANGTDILIPLTGSPANVFIDSVLVGAVGYNQCRGTVGNPVPPGAFCNDDVADIFGNPVPLVTPQARTANPTKFRNLDAGRGAIGAFVIDTTTLTNGLHTIQWNVSDSAGRADGIGSRFFTVANTGGDALSAADAPAAARAAASTLETFASTAGGVWGRLGFDLTTPWTAILPGSEGVLHVQLPDLGRFELGLGPTDAGYLVANDTLRDLPPGSHLDPATGSFGWMPGPGYIGTYRLAFLQGGNRTLVDATILPAAAPDPTQSQVRMFIDMPTDQSTVSNGLITIAGWALDPQAFTGSGIDVVDVWASRHSDGQTTVDQTSAQFLGAAQLHGARPDVAQAFGAQFNDAGFDLATSGLAPGDYDITVYVHTYRTAQWEDARTVKVTIK